MRCRCGRGCVCVCYVMIVVVVVVVTMREGSRGSGPRFDWENFNAAKFCAASSLDREKWLSLRKDGGDGYEIE